MIYKTASHRRYQQRCNYHAQRDHEIVIATDAGPLVLGVVGSRREAALWATRLRRLGKVSTKIVKGATT